MAEQLVNVHDLVGRCPFATSQKLLAGKWSLLIMHELSELTIFDCIIYNIIENTK